MLRVEPTGPSYDTAWLGEVPVADATAVYDEESGSVTLFAVNRDQRESVVLDVDLRAFPRLAVGEHVAVYDDDPDAYNSADQPDRVSPTRQADLKVADGRVSAVLPALSWNMLRLVAG